MCEGGFARIGSSVCRSQVTGKMAGPAGRHLAEPEHRAQGRGSENNKAKTARAFCDAPEDGQVLSGRQQGVAE